MDTGDGDDSSSVQRRPNKPSVATTERPLAGAVICCTSVAPEVRSRLADHAHQMGAEHKLDLTSDVTHLLVGDTDTLKYKYVARERGDVKVLRPEWVEAVRDCWMNARTINLDALAAEYRLPTFSGLRICITGFDDLSFRARLQNNVIENGGDYTGDLTKDVTHLIAARPEGKKYEYGTQWQKKVVGLKWYKDTLSRGMQLDESLYHPSKPIDEQGIGAWNPTSLPQSHLGKRSHEENAGPEPPRKLRRTASARLGSQNDHLWTDIVGGGGFEESELERPPLRPSKSLPAIVPQADRLTVQPGGRNLEGPETVSIRSGYFNGKYFAIHGFDQKKRGKLRQILLERGGVVVDTLEQLNDRSYIDDTSNIMVVPYDTPLERTAPYTEACISLSIVSELWLEWCMFKKSYISPESYPLSALVSQQKPPGFSRLTINVTGFPGIQTLHIAKILKLLGAQYYETFTTEVSVLICKESVDSRQKLDYASCWHVPAVLESWLWSSLREKRVASFEKHVFGTKGATAWNGLAKLTKQGEGSTVAEQPTLKRNHTELHVHQLHELRNPGSDFLLHDDHGRPELSKAETALSISKERLVERLSVANTPLQEISPNSPTKGGKSEHRPKKPLFRSLGGPSSEVSAKDVGETAELIGNAENQQSALLPEPPEQDIAGEIRDFYNMRANSRTSNNPKAVKSPRKGRLQGRALSNLSNASATPNVRQSRASSVDSINTDGVGSEVGPVASGTGKSDVPETRSFKGRAKSRLVEDSGPSIELGDPGLYRDETITEEAAPQMTQLVYDDSEDTIALREKLAARRRQRSRFGQKNDDQKPGELKEPRRIKDNDIIASAGWGAGRRTRHKDKSPPDFKDF